MAEGDVLQQAVLTALPKLAHHFNWTHFLSLHQVCCAQHSASVDTSDAVDKNFLSCAATIIHDAGKACKVVGQDIVIWRVNRRNILNNEHFTHGWHRRTLSCAAVDHDLDTIRLKQPRSVFRGKRADEQVLLELNEKHRKRRLPAASLFVDPVEFEVKARTQIELLARRLRRAKTAV